MKVVLKNLDLFLFLGFCAAKLMRTRNKTSACCIGCGGKNIRRRRDGDIPINGNSMFVCQLNRAVQFSSEEKVKNYFYKCIGERHKGKLMC